MVEMVLLVNKTMLVMVTILMVMVNVKIMAKIKVTEITINSTTNPSVINQKTKSASCLL